VVGIGFCLRGFNSPSCGHRTRLVRFSLPNSRLTGLYNLYAGITLQNESSVGLHRSCGFHQIGLERSVGFSTVVNAAYVGTFDRHAMETIPQNNVEFGSYALAKNLFNGAEVNANLLRTQYLGMGAVSTYCGCLSTLNYNALQTSLKHRFTKGLTFNANYQYSKGLGTAAMDAQRG